MSLQNIKMSSVGSGADSTPNEHHTLEHTNTDLLTEFQYLILIFTPQQDAAENSSNSRKTIRAIRHPQVHISRSARAAARRARTRIDATTTTQNR
jgi:F420-dependent methylenetetrahydromethanopterin dehydrogenase